MQKQCNEITPGNKIIQSMFIKCHNVQNTAATEAVSVRCSHKNAVYQTTSASQWHTTISIYKLEETEKAWL